ncbi:MAG: hypothetical protein J0I12_22580 [Candidatus Eremiobacteraeota bacterium]|nr:hypothetical protein [Candidatus Eremiobacteraeota bacterium]
MKKMICVLALTALAWGQEPTRLEGKVWAVESTAVYVTDSTGNAVKAPRHSTFLRNGQPVSADELKKSDAVVVIYPVDDFEILAGPYPPNDKHEYFHRTIRRGPNSLDQDYRDGVWVDR